MGTRIAFRTILPTTVILCLALASPLTVAGEGRDALDMEGIEVPVAPDPGEAVAVPGDVPGDPDPLVPVPGMDAEAPPADVPDPEPPRERLIDEEPARVFGGAGVRGTVNVGELNIRSGPGGPGDPREYEIVVTVRRGTPVTAHAERDGWLCISYPPREPCYMLAAAVAEEAPTVIPEDGIVRAVAADADAELRRVFCRPWTKSTVVGHARPGDLVTVLGRRGRGRNGEMYKIRAPETARAWVAAKYIDFERERDLPTARAPEPGVFPKKRRKPDGGARPDAAADDGSEPADGDSLEERIRRIREIREALAEQNRAQPAGAPPPHAVVEESTPPEPTPSPGTTTVVEEETVLVGPPSTAVAEAEEEMARERLLSEVEAELARIRAETQARKAEIASDPDRALAERKNVAPDAVTGWVEYYGRGFQRPADYCLVKGGEMLYLLRSESFNLREFIGKRVAVDGDVSLAPGFEANILDVTMLELLGEGLVSVVDTEILKPEEAVIEDDGMTVADDEIFLGDDTDASEAPSDDGPVYVIEPEE